MQHPPWASLPLGDAAVLSAGQGGTAGVAGGRQGGPMASTGAYDSTRTSPGS